MISLALKSTNESDALQSRSAYEHMKHFENGGHLEYRL